MAEREPAEAPAMELSWLMIERARIDREINRLRRDAAGSEEATGEGDPKVVPYARVVELQRERAKIADAIATRGG